MTPAQIAKAKYRASPKGKATEQAWRDANAEKLKKASREYKQRWREKNGGLDALRVRKCYARRASSPEGRVGILVAKAKARAAKRDYPFDLAPEDLFPLPSHCPVLGIELDYGLKGVARANGNSASLDRLDPIKGYTKGNVIVISNRANTLKNNGTATEHLAIAEYITRNTP